LLGRLAVAAYGDQAEKDVSWLLDALGALQERLRGMPLQIRSPGQNRGTIFLDDVDGVVSLQWTRWTLDPVGSGWPVDEGSLGRLDQILDDVRIWRPELRSVTRDQVSLAALLFELERLCRAQLFTDAIELIPRLIEVNSALAQASSAFDRTVSV
jgi:hypothetical protein